MIVSHTRRFVFVHIHKTAGESITATLEPELSERDLVVSTGLPRSAQGNSPMSEQSLPLYKHSMARDIRRHLGDETWQAYFTFSFVRHPVDRAVSLYRYIARMAATQPPSPAQRVRRMLRPDPNDPRRWPGMKAFRAVESFSEFIRHPLLEQARGMPPQSESLCDTNGVVIVDFVGRFERLEEDFRHVQERIGLGPRLLQWENSARAVALPRAEVTDDDRAYLADRFSQDFERFGYEV